ncbi:acetolactate synthase-1/2/3 large subunit [Nocardioides zeae]|uniref:Acetolactate synthase-1/2/3 large subunit n=1 Tax=Nocardioides zeae TaxID=1457234 RepID=A0ACC6IFI4_9ACTN|nr:thiamine pyrophosphate-binding protein [Nocardioides zeae]MDR6176524.1 acetolactate synthase-1/2/3 large subunit [Nocardioides zeae]MDR6209536.1 acetolactate synthase-1/2/3 large subunit [Nocardioides zeae]
MTLVRDAIGNLLVDLGVRTVFGVVGSGNFHYTNAMTARGARFVAARHEGGAATMADAHARMSDEVTVLSLHQGCGYTNALTGIAEAAKSSTRLLVLTAEATEPTSNFSIDQAAMAVGAGALAMRVRSPETALVDVARAFAACQDQSRTVVLNVPIDVQDRLLPEDAATRQFVPVAPPQPALEELERFADLLLAAERPVFVAGRGSRSPGAKEALRELAARTGALLATSAVARGMFNDDRWGIDVSGGFSSPLTAELVAGADLVVGFGCALNMWTMRHGRLIAPDATVVQVDIDPSAIGRNRDVDLGLWGGVAPTAAATTRLLADRDEPVRTGYRTPEIGERIRSGLRWNQLDIVDESADGLVDPRALTTELNNLLPTERIVSVDSGNFLGFPSMYLDVPDEYGFCFTQAFQSVGLGLATGIGAALARPDRLPVVGVGDGGFLMGISELETAVRLGLPLLVVVYDDAMYGAEVHHFGAGEPLDHVTFPDGDLAAIARGHGCDAVTVRDTADLAAVKDWVSSGPTRPMVIDAKVLSREGSWWLHEAFGH